jgi:hypothetical protein
LASAVCDRSVEVRRARTLAALHHFNGRDFVALADCFAGVVTSFRPEFSGGSKGPVTIERDEFITHLERAPNAKGPLIVREITADRGLVLVVLQLEDGSLGSNIMQFTKDDLIERTFMRRGIRPSRERQAPVERADLSGRSA